MAKKTSKVESARIGPSTEVEGIKQLVKIMVESSLSEVYIEDGNKIISLKRGGAAPVVTSVAAAPAPVVVHAPAAAPVAAPAAAPAAKAASNLIEIKSPMVGTFYAAPSPDSEPYAKVGATIADESVVCIVEAMKVMNEIKAECSGTIAEICVKNAQPVEFGQVLFRVKP